MAMFNEYIKRAIDPCLPRIEEQVISKRVRPIVNRHAGLVAGHQSANPDQRKRRAAQQHRHAMRPRTNELCVVGDHVMNFELTKNAVRKTTLKTKLSAGY